MMIRLLRCWSRVGIAVFLRGGGAVWLGIFSCLLASAAGGAEVAPEQAQFFENKVRPLLANRCYKCHGEQKQNGGLRVDSRGALLQGGESGPAINPGNPHESPLVRAVKYEDLEMPPTGKLPESEVATLVEWVKLGAPWPGSPATGGASIGPAVRREMTITTEDRQFWSFQKVVRPPLPSVTPVADAPVQNGVDRFLQAILQTQQLAPAPAAERRELARRAYFDLLGLPPTLQEVREFVDDPAPDAYERLLDRLLARPQYGERWGRHWLDLARFAQSNGYERDDEKPLAWRYRDYVIRALNRDKPYDQFIREQIAGDELPEVTDDALMATAFYRLGVWDDEPDDKRAAEFDELDDVVSTVGSTFLGLSVGCARCHDHKFDPIPQEDYYRLVAFVRNISLYGNEASATHSKPNPHGIYAELSAGGRTLAVRNRAGTPAPTHVLLRGSAASPGKAVEPAVLQVLQPTTLVAAARAPHSPPEPSPPEPSSTGNHAVAGGKEIAGRRRALAEWIAATDNPLTARVIANRLWHYHFGRGLVATPSDFGRTGEAPSHPELLDWLADELTTGGWQLKSLHRTLMTSHAYRQSSAVRQPAAVTKDPDNRLLWRQNLRRLEAEAIRDAVLAASGNLNLTMGGRGVFPTLPREVLATQSRPGNGWNTSPPHEQTRRSVYVFVKRTLGVPLLESFDVANPDKPIPARSTTTIAPQALILLNSQFMEDQAAAMAERLMAAQRVVSESATAEVPVAAIRRAFELALARVPTEQEQGVAAAYWQSALASAPANLPEPARRRHALTMLCKLVLNLNEFVYID